MSIPAAEQKQNSDQKPGMLSRWGLNALLVWVALLTLSVTFHALGNSLGSFASFFNATSIAVFLMYGLVFAFAYDRISGLWSPRKKRKAISFFDRGLENDKHRALSIRLLDGIGFAFSLAITYYGARYMISGGMLGDIDGDGAADSSDIAPVLVWVISGLVLESGGRTESDDDEEDATPPITAKPGG